MNNSAMQIIDNFGIISRGSSDKNSWLETILNKIKDLSSKDFVLRLTGIPEGNTLKYKLVNNRNKTHALIYRKHQKIFVEIFRRLLPDPEKYIKPVFSVQDKEVFNVDTEGIEKASIMLQKALDEETIYSLDEVVKVKVYVKPQDIPWTFYGGRISQIDTLDLPEGTVFRVYVENNSHHYDIPLDKTINRRICVLKYIVFNDKGGFEMVHSDEFNAYFEMAK
jgi:hypothetical protein